MNSFLQRWFRRVARNEADAGGGDIVARARVAGDGSFMYNEGFASAGRGGPGAFSLGTTFANALYPVNVKIAPPTTVQYPDYIWLVNWVGGYGGYGINIYFYKWDSDNKVWVPADPGAFDVMLHKAYTPIP